MKIKIITTGGTIDKLYFDQLSEFQVGEPEIGELLKEANVSFEYEVQSLLKKDSLDLTDADRALIRKTVEEAAETHVLVTHGTDTMIDSARVLEAVSGKVIVLTGAMNPARLRGSDAVFNIGFAMAALQLLPAGAYIAMNGRIFTPGEVRKNRAAHRFEPL